MRLAMILRRAENLLPRAGRSLVCPLYRSVLRSSLSSMGDGVETAVVTEKAQWKRMKFIAKEVFQAAHDIHHNSSLMRKEREEKSLQFIHLLRETVWHLLPFSRTRDHKVPLALLEVATQYKKLLSGADTLRDDSLYPSFYQSNRVLLRGSMRKIIILQREVWEKYEPRQGDPENAQSIALQAIEEIEHELQTIEQLWQDREHSLVQRAEALAVRLSGLPMICQQDLMESLTTKPSNHSKKCIEEPEHPDRESRERMECEAKEDARTEQVLGDVQLLAQQAKHDLWTVQLTTFGSRVNLLGSPSSDLDVSLAFYYKENMYPKKLRGQRIPMASPQSKHNMNKLEDIDHNPESAAQEDKAMKRTSQPKKAYEIPHMIERIYKAAKKSSQFEIILYLPVARIPLLKLLHKPTNIEVDIGIENNLGVINTLLIRSLIQKQPSSGLYLRAIKRWATLRDINNPFARTLSSFAWNLTAIFSWQQCPWRGAPTSAGPEPLESSGPQIIVSDAFDSAYAAHLQHQQAMKQRINFAIDNNEQVAMFETRVPHTVSAIGQSPLAQLVHFFAFYGTDDTRAGQSFDFYEDIVDVAHRPTTIELDPSLARPSSTKSAQESTPLMRAEKIADSERRMNIIDVFDRGNIGRTIDSEERVARLQLEFRKGLRRILRLEELHNSTSSCEASAEKRQEKAIQIDR